MTGEPLDLAQRRRFIEELERNFSVVASAGSGKTRAITDRIVALARHEKAVEWLPSLLVVTYTNRAADEMQQRARQSLLEAGVSLPVLAAFNRAFFGTIHSLCLKLLRQHGHHLGLPGKLDHLAQEDDAALWTEFIQRAAVLRAGLNPAQSAALFRLISARDLLELGRRGLEIETLPPLTPFPVFDFAGVHTFIPSKQSLAAAGRSQAALRRWETAWAGNGFVGAPPLCESKPLQAIWQAALAPITKWRQESALHVAAEISKAYQQFRLSRGVMTFGDQIALAAELLTHPEAAPRIRAKGYRVILDEAQDTDPTQFDVLLEIARPPEAQGIWPDELSAPPRPGHFCMVGDFQQSIYGGRADLGRYRHIHRALVETGAGEELTFSVTFRLDAAAIHFVNAVFPALLHGHDRQVSFVSLSPRPDVSSGQIVRFDPEPDLAAMTDWKNGQKMFWEADRVAEWLRAAGLKKLRASSWREVAILCPRTRWLAIMRSALRRVGLQAQVQSERAIKGDSPAYAWFTALVVIMAEPGNGYEIVGVLREAFGISDHDLAAYSEGQGGRFHLTGQIGRAGPVADALRLLTELRERIISLPLFAALEEMVRTVRLRDRLLALPADEFENLDLELDELLTQAAAAEAMQATLSSFSVALLSGFHAPREVRGTAPDAVQLISGHKAKGSEWDAVIVPFFARGITVRKSPYPRVLRDPREAKFTAAFDGNDIDENLKAALDQQDEQELERLLYVAFTRARRTLVVVDDRTIFAGKKGLQAKSQARLLRCASDNVNAASFSALPTTLTPCAETAAQQTERAKKTSLDFDTVLPLAELDGKTADHSRERATHFLKRNPSALAEAALAESEPAVYEKMEKRDPGLPNSGQRHGTWWHKFVEGLDWPGSPTRWDATFAEHIIYAPDEKRARKEWELLRQQMTTDSDLARLIAAKGIKNHAEMPFLWAMSERECLDGIIDLAAFHPETNRWIIVDWKTNRLTEGGVEALRAHYLPQLSAYWKAATEMLRAPVIAGLYSTVAGEWLPYSTEELASEWEKLQRNPQSLAAVMDEPDGD